MSKISSKQLEQIAQNIASLLDNKDSKNGDGKIEASIWNQFVNGGSDKNNEKVGNGKKSEIKNSITINQAKYSIMSYLNNKDFETIKDSLEKLGIDYDFKTSERIPIKKPDKYSNKNKYKLGKREGDTRIITPDSIQPSIYERKMKINGREVTFYSRVDNNRQHTNIENTADGFLSDSRQVGRGDCYFMAAINGLRNSHAGQKILQDNCKRNSDGSITIKLPGAIKIKEEYKKKGLDCHVTGTYHISKESLEKASKSNQYSKGDIEVIAFEIAMEAYRAEMSLTVGKKKERFDTAEGSIHDEVGLDGDVLSAGFTHDAHFILTGNKSEAYYASNKNSKKVSLYTSGKFGYVTREQMAKMSSADISMYNTKGSGTVGISELSYSTSDKRYINTMLDKYKGKEDQYSLTFNVIVAKKGKDNKTKAGGGHALTVVKITDDIIFVSNPWYPDKIEPIPRQEFIKMTTGLIASPLKKDNWFTPVENGFSHLMGIFTNVLKSK